MTTPLVMLILMTAPYLLVQLRSFATGRAMNARPAAAIGLAILFAFTASGHFIQTGPMVQMLPAWVPGRAPLVYLTGILEIAIALGFALPAYRSRAGWVAASVLVAFFPANIYAAINHVPMGGHAWGPVYLWVRAPLQLAILVWVYLFTIRRVRQLPSPSSVRTSLKNLRHLGVPRSTSKLD